MRYPIPNLCLPNIRTNPAPLDLCLLDNFDSAEDTRLCPAERTALSIFYEAAKGGDWTINTNWLTQYGSHCDWHGVTCNGETVVELALKTNGLSGILSKEIKKLRSLYALDLSDNDIKVSKHRFCAAFHCTHLLILGSIVA